MTSKVEVLREKGEVYCINCGKSYCAIHKGAIVVNPTALIQTKGDAQDLDKLSGIVLMAKSIEHDMGIPFGEALEKVLQKGRQKEEEWDYDLKWPLKSLSVENPGSDQPTVTVKTGRISLRFCGSDVSFDTTSAPAWREANSVLSMLATYLLSYTNGYTVRESFEKAFVKKEEENG